MTPQQVGLTNTRNPDRGCLNLGVSSSYGLLEMLPPSDATRKGAFLFSRLDQPDLATKI